MTANTPTADTNLVKPARGTVPSPLRVSTMHELEYGTVVLRFGRDLPSGTSKVYCKGITLTVPTGVSGADLTREPSLITTAVSIVEGEAQGTEWWVDRDTTDPNKAVFSFVPDTTAVFDGTWAVSFTLSGIEVNPSIGTVDLKVEETTSTTGADGSYQKRTGQVEVKKGNDEFFFRSLRPRTTVIGRGVTVDLLWDAPADTRIQYTMYYRGANGQETYDNNQAKFANRKWTSPVLNDNANFTLKATLDGQDYYLTTYLTVNDPNIVVNSLSASGNVTVDPGANGYIWLKTGRFDTTAEATVNLYGVLNANGNVTVAANKTLTANGPVQANGNVTIKADKTLSAGDVTIDKDRTLSAGDVTIDKDRTLKVTWVDPTVANGTINVRGSLTVATGKTLTTNGPIQANSNVTVDPGATGYIWLKTGRFDTAAEATVNLHGALNSHGHLTMAAGKNITIPLGGGQLAVADAFVAKSHHPNWTYPKVEIGPAANVPTEGNIVVGGKRVLRDGDSVTLKAGWAQNGYLWDNDGSSTKDQGNVVRKINDAPVNNLRSRWTLGYRSSNNPTVVDPDGDADAQE
ncbi:hypothetical protein OG500_05035 [Kitasatospora sp. NBC_01250]|uniref:hypothetical protein n=1 Tax=Kitasatospora sp. NBC_01250 TaxID=2903571 RepID=UPI002E34DC8A|nr:hypothetical protein [Kitasatospora sp. NBC_01250]